MSGIFIGAICSIVFGYFTWVILRKNTYERKSQRLEKQTDEGDEKTTIRKKLEENVDYLKIETLIVLVLMATVIFWGTFFLTIVMLNALRMYTLSLCVPAIFSAFIAGLVLIYVEKESVGQKEDK